jgi:hypothetical protein
MPSQECGDEGRVELPPCISQVAREVLLNTMFDTDKSAGQAFGSMNALAT